MCVHSLKKNLGTKDLGPIALIGYQKWVCGSIRLKKPCLSLANQTVSGRMEVLPRTEESLTIAKFARIAWYMNISSTGPRKGAGEWVSAFEARSGWKSSKERDPACCEEWNTSLQYEFREEAYRLRSVRCRLLVYSRGRCHWLRIPTFWARPSDSDANDSASLGRGLVHIRQIQASPLFFMACNSWLTSEPGEGRPVHKLIDKYDTFYITLPD